MASSKRINELDGLRSLAILLVLLRHFWVSLDTLFVESAPVFINQYVTNLFLNGWVGVDLFFILSGFLITRSLLQTHKDYSLKVFFLKRAYRILPAYYAVLFLCVVGAFPYYLPPVENQELLTSLLFHIFLLQDYYPANINIVFWSLGVEEKFYILAPALIAFFLLVLNRKGQKGFIAALSCFIILGIFLRYISFVSNGAPEAYDDFFFAARSAFHNCWEPLLIGVFIAFCEQKRLLSISSNTAQKIFYTSLIMLVILFMSHELMAQINLFDVLLQPLLITLLFGGMALATVYKGAPAWAGNRLCLVIARLSYSLYLVHIPLIPLAQVCIIKSGAGYAHEGIIVLLYFIIYLTLTFLAAALLYYAVERPFLRLKDRL